MRTPRSRRIPKGFQALVALALLASAAPPVSAAAETATGTATREGLELRVEALAKRQLEELGIPQDFFPFLRDDARVRTGRQIYGDPAPDIAGSRQPEILETDLRYRYSIAEGQQTLPSVESEVDTRIVVRDGSNGKKLWAKRYDRDAYPFSMRVGNKGRDGVVVVSGLWNFFGTTEESTLTFDAFDARGERLWSREYSSVSYYDLLTWVSKDAPVMIARFDGLEGRADDLLIGLATILGAPTTTTMSVRTLVVDGATGAERIHPLVDVGVDWWPIPLPTGDLDGDGLDDYATTNNLGIDPGDGDSQEPPSAGGTVYSRRGTDGTPIWTTSGLKMALYAFTDKFPDVVAGRTPDIAVSTYVAREEALPVPFPVPDVLPLQRRVWYRPRVYLLEGSFGSVAWHKPWEWAHSPGDVDRNGKHDVVLGRFRASFKKGTTTFDQLAVDGLGRRMWARRSVWRFETMPCPRKVCFGGWGFWFDAASDYQPDRVRDVFLYQEVEQNAAFEDRLTRVYDGRSGRIRFEDDSERTMQPAGVSMDGRGADLVGFEYGSNEVYMTARNGSNRMLWGGTLAGPDKLVPRNSGFWASGFRLRGDGCGDLVVNGYDGNDSFYGVFEGGGGRLLWSRWTGQKGRRLTFEGQKDRNPRC